MSSDPNKLRPKFEIGVAPHLRFVNADFGVICMEEKGEPRWHPVAGEQHMGDYLEALEVMWNVRAEGEFDLVFTVGDALCNPIPIPPAKLGNRQFRDEIMAVEIHSTTHLAVADLSGIKLLYDVAELAIVYETEQGSGHGFALVKLKEEVFVFLAARVDYMGDLSANVAYQTYLTLLACYYAGADEVMMTCQLPH